MSQLTFLEDNLLNSQEVNAPKTSDLQCFQVSCALNVSVSWATFQRGKIATHAHYHQCIYLSFLWKLVQLEFCLLDLNNMFTIFKDTKLLAGRGLRDASDVLHPCKKQRIKPWRPMLYWTGAEEYVYPFNVNLCCFELLTSGSKTARNILTWLWLIFKDNFFSFRSSIVGRSLVKSILTYLKERIFSAVYKSQNPHMYLVTHYRIISLC